MNMINKKMTLFAIVILMVITISEVSAAPLSITINDVIIDATGQTTTVTTADLGTPNVNGGEQPYDISRDPTGDISLGVDQTIDVTWTATNNSAQDPANVLAKVVQKVTVKDMTAPLLTITGDNPVNINVGDAYNDAGATAIDIVDGDITGNIVPTGLSIDTSAAGTYTVTYDVSDKAGNSAQKKRTVNVKPVPVIDLIPPVITLLGSATVTINVGDVYTDAGATASDNIDGDITIKIKETGLPINTNVAGTYTVKYDVSDKAGNPAQQKTRTVNVVPAADNIPPVITILGPNPATVNVGETYTDAGATASDNIDGDITGDIVTTGLPIDTTIIGTHTVTYSITDSAGNPAQKKRTVNVISIVDNVPPIITMLGSNPKTIYVGDVYTDAGATASDNFDGDITGDIITTGLPINTSTTGTYTVTYDVTDSAGNPAQQKTRTVNVVPVPIKLAIISYDPSSPITDTAPSNVKFNITTNIPANVTWSRDGVIEQSNMSVTKDSYRRNIETIGTYTVVATARDGIDTVSQTWTWDVQGTLSIHVVHPSSEFIGIGQPTNITFRVDRRCGIEATDSCNGTGRVPVVGASISLTGVITGSGTTNDTGLLIMTGVNATTDGTINATASKSGYISNSTQIVAGVAPTPTPTPCCSNTGGGGNSGSSSSSGGGGGGGGSASPEPYSNILKYESKEEYIGINPVIYRYTTSDLSIYEISVTGFQSDDTTIRVEILNGISKLVGVSPSETVYKNINIWANSKRIKNAIIRYKVENSWIKTNGISPSDIKMSKWDNTTKRWNGLITRIISNDSSYTYLESDTTGFSSFAINVPIKNTGYATSGPDGTDTAKIDSTTGGAPIDVGGDRKNFIVFEIIASIIIIGLAVYLLRMRKS